MTSHLLNFAPAELRTYPQETVVAEKLHGMVTFGIANSRMKDFYDVWFLSTRFPFDGTILTKAIASTFSRRKTDVPLEIPLALTDEFAHDDQKQAHWASFTDRTRIDTFESDLGSVIEQLRSFLWSPLKAVNMSSSFEKRWPPEGPWTTVE